MMTTGEIEPGARETRVLKELSSSLFNNTYPINREYRRNI